MIILNNINQETNQPTDYSMIEATLPEPTVLPPSRSRFKNISTFSYIFVLYKSVLTPHNYMIFVLLSFFVAKMLPRIIIAKSFNNATSICL